MVVPFRASALKDTHLLNVLQILREAHTQFFRRADSFREADIKVGRAHRCCWQAGDLLIRWSGLVCSTSCIACVVTYCAT